MQPTLRLPRTKSIKIPHSLSEKKKKKKLQK